MWVRSDAPSGMRKSDCDPVEAAGPAARPDDWRLTQALHHPAFIPIGREEAQGIASNTIFNEKLDSPQICKQRLFVRW